MQPLDSSQSVSLGTLFATYGEALYLAQSMEVGMRIFYWLDKALPNTPPGKNPRIDFDSEPLPDINVNSLGGFIRQFRREMMEEGGVDVETRNIMRKLEQSADDRNWLVHTFWWERSNCLDTKEDRANLLVELQGLVDQFRYNDQLIRRLVLLCLEHFDLTYEQFPSPRFQGYIRGDFFSANVKHEG
jgi:hypothetical protein